MIKKLYSMLFMLSVCFCASAQETDTIVRKYAIDEEWYIQGQIGFNYLAAENTRYVNFKKIAQPEQTIAFGKRFTPIWGARFQGQWGDDTGVFYGHDSESPTYTFSHASYNLIGSFNFSEYRNRKQRIGYNRRWNISALLGLGVVKTNFDTTKDLSEEQFLDLNSKTFTSLFAGIEAAYSLNPHWDLTVELGSHWRGKQYNGMIINRKFWLKKIDQSIPLLIGVRYTFHNPRRKFVPSPIVYTQPEPTQIVSEPKEHGNIEPKDSALLQNLITAPDCYTIEELAQLARERMDIRGKQLCCGEGVTFAPNKAEINLFSTFFLDRVVEIMQTQPVNLVLKGIGGKRINMYVTDLRMKAIRDYLEEHGIERDRLVYQYVPVGTPCVDRLTIRLEFLEYAEQSMEDCSEIEELLQQVRAGKSIRGKNICGIDMVNFDLDKDIIKPEFASYLNMVALLMSYTDINILIMGHTDIQGTVEYNYDLSERRAKAVLNYLNSKGVNYNRMMFSYHSKLIPFTENKTEKGRSINRRCEFMILP